MSTSTGPKTFTASEAIAKKLRVSIVAASTTDPPEVEIADATTHGIGTNEVVVAINKLCAIDLFSSGKSSEVVAAGAFAVGATLYPAAGGKVDDAVSGNPLGTAIEAATADEDIVEMIPVVNTDT